MGSGGQQSKSTTEQSPEARALTEQIRRQIEPIGDIYSQQAQEALKTGGAPTAQLPLVQSALEQTRSAQSQAQTQSEEQLRRAGLFNTPFGQNIRAQQELSGDITAAQIPSQIASQYMGVAPNIAFGTGANVIQGLSGFGTSTTKSGGKGEFNPLSLL